ncbi:MAG: formate dehydrogenase accessory sulfurtransferase FdhD [Actinobacteria bacterium]|nr:formate dehydrogenase accessory sulfurtransferase FdhD [Actinomycetota bacterium]
MEKNKDSTLRETGIVRYHDGESCPSRDLVALEEPLEIRVNGKPLVRLMRLPGDDIILAAGFLFSEGLISSAEGVNFSPVTASGEGGKNEKSREASLNIDAVDVTGEIDPDTSRFEGAKLVKTGSGGSEFDLRVNLDGINVDSTVHFNQELIAKAPDLLLDGQDVFRITGATHAACIFDSSGRLVAVREDVGRHNAVDKALGCMLLLGEDSKNKGMVLSGRLSFEMVLKVARAGIPLICSVSAPTSLGIYVGEETGVTMVGFLRGGNFNVYCHPYRIGGC